MTDEEWKEKLMEIIPLKMNCPCGKFNCHGNGWDACIEEIIHRIEKIYAGREEEM